MVIDSSLLLYKLLNRYSIKQPLSTYLYSIDYNKNYLIKEYYFAVDDD